MNYSSLVFSFLLVIFFCFETVGQTKYLNSYDGTKIAYTDTGSGKPILLIHGFISNASSWDRTEVKKQLINHGYRVIIPDLRGNGYSEKPKEEEKYTENAEVKDLITLMNHLEIKKYYALGYSRGSIILAKLLIKDRRIKKAVLGGMGIDFTDPDWDRRKMFQAGFEGKTKEFPETLGAVKYAKSIGADLYIMSLLQKYQPVTSRVELRTIKAKVLVIAGIDDTDNGDPKDLHLAIKKSKLSMIPGDHNNAYKTGFFAKEVLNFL